MGRHASSRHACSDLPCVERLLRCCSRHLHCWQLLGMADVELDRHDTPSVLDPASRGGGEKSSHERSQTVHQWWSSGQVYVDERFTASVICSQHGIESDKALDEWCLFRL